MVELTDADLASVTGGEGEDLPYVDPNADPYADPTQFAVGGEKNLIVTYRAAVVIRGGGSASYTTSGI